MTRFTFKGDVTWGSGAEPRSFRVMTQNQAGFKAFARTAGRALVDGILLLENTLAALGRAQLSSELQRYANRYFLTGKTLDKADADKIEVILKQTLLGMKGDDFAVKIAATQADDRPGMNGYVNGADRLSTGAKMKFYHNWITELGNGKNRIQGAIHITGERLDQGRLGVKSLVHEATHKYAGTEDYVYFESDGVVPQFNFDKKDRALKNADSYAWFAIMVGRDGGEFKSKMYD